MRELEGLYQIILANNTQPGRFTQGTVFINHLIYHVPAFDAATVTAHNGGYMFVHAGQQHCAREGLAVFTCKDPGRRLAVPDQRVADDEHLVGFPKSHVAVRIFKIKMPGGGMDLLPFQIVFGCDGIEMRFDQGRFCLIRLIKLGFVQRRPDVEVIFKNVFQRWHR